MRWGDVSSWVAVVVSVAVAIRAVISERRAKASADRAGDQRQRTVAAAERSAKAVEEVAAAIRGSGVGSSTAPAPPHQGPTWGVEHRSGSVYALVNNTAFPQTAVTVTGPCVRRGGGPYDEIKAFSEIEFFGHLTAQMSDRAVTVEWTDQNGARQEWSKPLPPKR